MPQGVSSQFAVFSVLPLARCNPQEMQSKQQFQAGWAVPWVLFTSPSLPFRGFPFSAWPPSRHLNWTFSSQLNFGQFPTKIVPGMHIPRRKRKTAKGKSVSCAIAHTGLDYSIVNMGSAIFFPPNTHQQQHFATSCNAFLDTSSDAHKYLL